MKLKRFVAVVISLAMVLSIVPAFSLTASAAEEVVLFDATSLDRTDSTGDIALSEGNWSGDWGAVFSNNWGDNTGTWGSNGPTALMFFRTSARQNGSSDYKTATYGGASASAGANKITISFRYAIQDVSDCYQTWYFRDIDGNNFARFYGDKNTGSGTASVGLNTQTTFISSGGTLGIRGQEFSIVATQGASNWTVEYYQGETLLNTDTVDSINGFGSVYADIGQWNTQWAASGMQGLKITYEMPETAKEIVATYTAGGTTVNTVSKTIDTSLTDSASFDEYYYSVNGTNTLYYAAAQTLTDSATIEMTALSNKGSYAVNDEIVINNTPYTVKSANLIPNYNFEYGTAGWFGGDGNQLGASVSGNAVTLGNAGGGNNASLNQSWALESGKTYLYTYNTTSGGNTWHITSLQNALKADENTTDAPVLVGTTNGSEHVGTLAASDATGTNNFVFTNTDGYAYLQSAFRWTGATFSNFGLYEVEVDSSKIANTTIKFVDSSDGETEIADAVTITGVVGDVIDLSAYTGAITYNGNPYSFDSTNPTSHTVVGNTDVVTLTYTTDAYVSFTGTPVTVIAGNDPVLSTTVTAVTGAGSTTVVDGAVWADTTGLAAGTHEVSGTVTIDGNTINGTVTVTVLPMTFETNDLASNATVNFPVDVTGDFYLEFDYNASNLDNMWIYASANGALWGSGQIGLGWDADGNGYFRAQPAAQTDIQFETNKTYRFLVHGNVDTDTYDLTVYDTVTKEAIFTCDDYGFRSGSDVINSITATSNGEGGVATLSNIKVYAPDQADQFTTITFVATGSVSETYTTSYTSAEEFPIPHYDGHIMKTRTISGTTVTATYEATTTSTGSWYMRNNFTDDNWLSQSKYIGSHNAFADTDDVFVNEGGALYGDTGASGTSSTYIANSRTQSVGALDQLNAGVRYFDVRLSRQSDGTFATVHGPAFENFRDVAITMAQWAKENPGEVIILDFQTVRDALYDNETYTVITDNDSYYGPDEGDDNQYVYDALVQLFEETGLADYMTTDWDRKYGPVTNYGTQTAIIPFGKGRAVNCQGGYFINRSALYNDVTYAEDTSYSAVVSTLNDTYSSLAGGATICTIHGYTTPLSLFGSTNLIDDAQSNNPNWINEANFELWMGYDKGDVFMMNDAVSDIELYYNKLNSFNRTGSTYSYSANFTRTDNGVTIDGAQANVPYSTKFTVSTGDASAVGTLTIDGTAYTPVTAYNVALMQFNTNSVQPTDSVTLTFPQVSDGSTTVDVLLSADGSTVLATAEVGQAISYSTTSIGNYILATMVAPGQEYTVNYVANGTTLYTTTELVPYGQVVYSVPAGDFYLATADKAYILNSAEAQSHTADSSDTTTTFTVDVTIVTENAVLADAFHNASDAQPWNNDDNMLFVGSAGVSDPGDADAAGDAVMANNGGNVGSARVPLLTFNVPEVAEGKAVKLHLYVAKANQNLNAGGSMKLAANVSTIEANETTNAYVAGDLANTTGVVWSDTMFTATGETVDGRISVDTWIEIDVTEFVKAATGEKITFTLYAPTAGAYVADREKAVAGGAYAGKAAYLEIVDANTVSVSGATLVTKSGKDVTTDAADGILVPAGSTIKVRETSDELIAFTDGTNVYTTDADGWVTLTPSSAAEYSAASLGVAMVDGAQVRIGDGVNADGTVAGDSGLRFITTVDKGDSLAAITGATFGVEITAESSTEVVDIPATKWQTEDEVYTSALTNLAVSNYNRNFTATPYVSINGTKYYGSAVTRSIYQVASGLLHTGYNGSYGESADETGKTDYTTMPEVLVKVLNGYVNQVGVRLVIADGVLAKSDKYTGSADTFFTVSNASTTDNVYTCTLTAVGDAEINTGLFNTYVRINNNNSAVKTLVSVVDNGDGTYTLTFDGSSLVTE